jgi:hypothetical protein
MAAASSGVIASRMCRKSTWATSSSVGISASSCQSGLPASLARRSQTALTRAPVAMCRAPFSGPIQRSCTSVVTERRKASGSPNSSSSDLPSTAGASARTAAQVISLPRPLVKVNPVPVCGPSVASST